MARPKSDSRERLVSAARGLLQRKGYQATGMSEIVAASGAPRGSVYFLFPGGKQELAVVAIEESAAEMAALIREVAASQSDVEAFCRSMVAHLGTSLADTDYFGGCPITTVTLDSTPGSAPLAAACEAAYRSWLAALAEALERYGVATGRAGRLATLLLSAMEGAMVLARAARSPQPLEDVLSEVLDLVVAAARG